MNGPNHRIISVRGTTWLGQTFVLSRVGGETELLSLLRKKEEWKRQCPEILCISLRRSKMATFLKPASSAIIPGLPDDLALRCLARLSHGYHGLLECVSKRWQDAVRSLDYAHLKYREGWFGDWLFVLTDNQRDTQWNAYDPDADRWHPLPSYLSACGDYSHLGFAWVSIHNRLLVIGGYHSPNGRHVLRQMASVKNKVMQFDPFKKQWSTVASMRTERADFACAVVCGKVYVGGGWNSSSLQLDVAEVYDPLEDRWEDLPPLSMLRKDCFGVSYKDRFHVFERKKHLAQRVTCRVFDPLDKRWCRLCTRVMLFPTMAVGDRFYTVDEGDGNSVKTRMKDIQEWETLGRIPPVVLPDHSRPLESFGYSITGLGTELYVVGGGFSSGTNPALGSTS